MDTESVVGVPAPVIGMVHLPALPGAPKYAGDRDAIHDRVRRDANALASGGVDAVLIENFGDAPFYPGSVPEHVVAEMTALTGTVRDAVDLPLGVNVLRNDGSAAVAIAGAVGAAFVRVNVHTGARVTDQGVIEGLAHETLRLRDRIDADVAILADIDVKHSAPLTQSGDRESVAELVERGLADGVIVSGSRTGGPTDPDAVRRVVEAVEARELGAPVFVGSGVTETTVPTLLDIADGAIVGTALKEDGETSNPVDPARVESLVAAADTR